MPFTYNTEEDVAAMLQAIGVASIEELLEQVPADFRLQRTLDLPQAMGEMELDRHMRELAGKNVGAASGAVSYLGGGTYDHFIPAVVDTIASRGEFYTSYTPYQAEVAQGNLQAMFEYQTLITRLTGLDVSNCSLYDGASAAAEAVMMALASGKGRTRVVLPASVHPEYRQTITTYVSCLDAEVVTVAAPNGVVDLDELRSVVNDQTACVVLQQPNFFGCVEDADEATRITHAAGALMIAAFDPISLGLMKRPGDWVGVGEGADIAVCEGQSLGTPMQYGGPFLGILACRESLVRRMPGRIVGQTTDRRGKRCFVLTMQTREQHIRRDKATSNVCSNQALFALRATVYLSLLGPEGLKETAHLCLQKSRYLAERLVETDRFELAFAAPTFKEFVLRDRQNKIDDLIACGLANDILAGLPLGQFDPELDDCLLVCVTEKRTREELDRFVEVLTQNAAHPNGGNRAKSPHFEPASIA
ncbi:aminomethyl-transferring glycine dehydrogenase subunit GcvPA [Botrimarina mediterranea]|uniref:Probable glycine dehydrogenase (decarboxylating) subunit 1 n=1 Tax=Botrimarina mediterranea TaxID=2528022 RepID=A0A518KCL1_9BACT|nr:aminomethyl-transferring glycine dehydrogenase subunit GcvPA [Botrimarina mediterranea]QDV75527.1 putative glycine dehydrogenase (decarboxylating) subunit 1 [Botrimarina mediterranea]QDV80161.1 putative glycine dehydrogenase (decarboxylating) subunit 1 [Planctomycetes bacterium K2D]